MQVLLRQYDSVAVLAHSFISIQEPALRCNGDHVHQVQVVGIAQYLFADLHFLVRLRKVPD